MVSSATVVLNQISFSHLRELKEQLLAFDSEVTKIIEGLDNERSDYPELWNEAQLLQYWISNTNFTIMQLEQFNITWVEGVSVDATLVRGITHDLLKIENRMQEFRDLTNNPPRIPLATPIPKAPSGPDPFIFIFLVLIVILGGTIMLFR